MLKSNLYTGLTDEHLWETALTQIMAILPEVNGGGFNIILSAFKLALLASFSS